MTGTGGWVYAQAVAAQAKTNELLLMSSSGGTDVSENAVEYWKNQSKKWNDAAKKWSGLLKTDKEDDGKDGPEHGKK